MKSTNEVGQIVKITHSNCYLEKHDTGYSICISLPDNSKNYIHSDTLSIIDLALKYRESLLLRSIEPENCTIKEEGSYYRINVMFEIYPEVTEINKLSTIYILFHSRKLNLNDAVFERDLLID